MNLAIPYQTLEISRIHMKPFQIDSKGRSIAHISYNDTNISLNDVVLLSPPLTVIDYDKASGRMRFSISSDELFLRKFMAMQQYLISTLFLHRLQFFQYDYSHADIEMMFQPLMDADTLSIFIYPTIHVKHCDGTLTAVHSLRPGDRVRFPLYIYGVMILTTMYNPLTYVQLHHSLPRLRIQHNVPYMWLITD
jgi:hypothetical protein